MKTLFCGYRQWSLDVFEKIRDIKPDIVLIQSPEMLSEITAAESWDVIFVVGWSWKIEPEIINKSLVVGIHPSDLPDYSGGSPIQNQILDGITRTNSTLFKLNEKFDEGDIIDKEPVDLSGHMSDVFNSISLSSVAMIQRFLNNYPDIKLFKQCGAGKKVRRIKPSDSRLENPVGKNGKMSCRELWDFIRCREDPYPNAFFEDDTGRIVVRHVEFYEKGSTDS